jgi:hypothetical protein
LLTNNICIGKKLCFVGANHVHAAVTAAYLQPISSTNFLQISISIAFHSDLRDLDPTTETTHGHCITSALLAIETNDLKNAPFVFVHCPAGKAIL